MAEVNNFYVESSTEQTTTSSTWSNVDTTNGRIAAASLSANTKYLIVARGLVSGSSAANKNYFRVQTADDTTIETKSETVVEVMETNQARAWSWLFVHSFTTDGTPDDIDLQFRNEASSTTRIDQYSLLVIDLDDLGSANYFEDAQAASGSELSTTLYGTTLATIAGSSLGTTDEWLILGYGRVGIGSTNRSFFARLSGADDASSGSNLMRIRQEGEDTSELRMFGFAARHKAVTSAVTVQLDASEENASSNMTDEGAYLIAIKASAFADFEHDYQTGEAEKTIASVGPYTPSANGNHILFGQAQHNVPHSSAKHWSMHLEDGTTETRTGDQGKRVDQGWDDTTDLEHANTFQRISISAEKTYNLKADDWDAQSDTLTLEHRWLLVLNLNKASTGTTVTPAVNGLTFAMPTPTILAAANVTPAVAGLTFGMPGPTAKGQARTFPAASALAFDVVQPTIRAAATVTPAVAGLAFDLPGPTPFALGQVTPAVAALVLAMPTPTLLAPKTVTPAVAGLTFDLPLPQARGAAQATPAVAGLTFDLPLPTILAAANVSPAVAALVFDLPQPTIVVGGSTVFPASLGLTFDLPTPAILAAANVTPAANGLTFDIPAPSAHGEAAVSPLVAALTLGMPQPAVLGQANVTPGVASILLGAPIPVINAEALVTPAEVALVLDAPAPALAFGATVSPATVALLLGMPTPTVGVLILVRRTDAGRMTASAREDAGKMTAKTRVG
jgi:hypothetical protein